MINLFNLQKKIHKKLNLKKKVVKFNFERFNAGNSKLSNSILIFDLPAGSDGSCVDCSACEGTCYAKFAQVFYPSTKLFRDVNFELAKNYPETLFTLLEMQLSSTKNNVVRIHSSGDFYDEKYVDNWIELIHKFPKKRFYCYSKSPYILERENLPKNLNVISSFLTINGKKYLNYGNMKYLTELQEKDPSIFLCPATTHKAWDGKCGKECKVCLTHNKIGFLLHGNGRTKDIYNSLI